MKQNENKRHPEAATDEPASPRSPAAEPATAEAGPPPSEGPPLLSDCLGESLDHALADTFPPGHRKPRHDGWTPQAIEGFLRDLAANGVVEHAARQVSLSAASAYAFRNRRHGRAFARMWDAVLVHRARARIASELQARAVAGCVSVRKKDGIVVSEYHYYDNRLAMALLTRLDRLAEKEAAGEAQLRALSEDLDDYLDCVASGGDADAFVEERRPPEPEPPEPEPDDDDPELTTFAHVAGCPDYLDVDPCEIDVADLDPTAKSEWGPDGWVRASRSGYLVWLEMAREEPGWVDGPGAPLRFLFEREAGRAAVALGRDGPGRDVDRDAIDTSDLDPASIWDWSDDQLVRASRSGLLYRLPAEFWDGLAAKQAFGGDEE